MSTAVQITNAGVSTAPPLWKTLYFNLRDFRNLPTTRDHYVQTPEFSCNGHQWALRIYPGGHGEATNVSIFLYQMIGGNITANYELMIIDKFGKKKKVFQRTNSFEGSDDGHGWPNFMKRSYILDESQNILDSDGTLTVGISIKEEPTGVYVTKNPLNKMIRGMFLDEDTADVCFEVCSAEAKEKEVKPSDLFHAHHFILKTGAPMLADLFDLEDRDGKLVTATVTDVKPDIFHHLLWYVYGGSVPEKELKKHAKDIIDAADKYSIINLKLHAETSYVKSTKITMDNVMDNLLYADAKNCALLKEAAMNFLAENSSDAAEKVAFDDVPGHLMKDLLVAFNMKDKSKKEASGATTDELTTLSVNALRRKLDEMDLSVDGSREAMIESIRNNS
jgi:speckle-type POZ protein